MIIEAFLQSRPEDTSAESMSEEAEVDELDAEDRDRIDCVFHVSLIFLTIMCSYYNNYQDVARYSNINYCNHRKHPKLKYKT